MLNQEINLYNRREPVFTSTNNYELLLDKLGKLSPVLQKMRKNVKMCRFDPDYPEEKCKNV
jgi:hypothetical protein